MPYQGNEVSKYHLEAAIAYWHTTPTDENQVATYLYNYIINLYLLNIHLSRQLNRAFEFARVYGWEKGIGETEKISVE